MFEFIDSRTLATLAHVFGVIIGAGGAFSSDLIFFSSVRDESISRTEARFMRLGSMMVWAGLILIILSGFWIFFHDPDFYLVSSKFLAKMTIVGILTVNGIFFHLIHLPRIHRHVGAHFPSSDEFSRKSVFLMMSGALSMVSWASAIILGSLRTIPYTYFEIMTVYGTLVFCAVFGALLLRKKILNLQ